MSAVFVTGTDTGIGKTHASVALLHAHRVHGRSAIGMKPIASGCRATPDGLRNEDAEALIAASDPAPPYALCNPFAFEPPIAPQIAARDAGIEIALSPIIDALRELASRADRVIVEGVGGWSVPLSDSLMQADLVRGLGIPVVLVVGLRLGCINHALLSARAIVADGCTLVGWIANRIDPAMAVADANVATLRERLGVPMLGDLAHGARADIASLARAALPALIRVSPRVVAWLVALAGFAFDIAAFWPGQMSFDSAYTWWQARGGTTTDIAPPVLIHLWRVCDALVEGPGLVFALHLALFWSGLALLADAVGATRWRAAALLLVVAMTPVTWLLRAHVWTDVGLFSALVFVAGALAQAQTTQRRAWIVAALPALFYAGAVRFNALPALLPFAIWIGWLVARSRVPIALVAAAAFFGAAAFAAIVNAQVDRHVPLWTATAEWDLAAISVATGEMRLPPFMIGPGLDVDELSHAFRHWSNVPMLQNTTHGMRDPFTEDYTPEQLATLRAAWLDAIRAHPRAWLAQKWRQAVALIDVHDADWPRELVYVDDEVQYRDNPPVARNRYALHVALMSAAEHLRTTRVLAGLPYLLIGLIAFPFAWRRRRELAGFIALTVLASAWLYLVPMLPIAAAELRYLGWPCVASVLAAAVVAFVPRAFGGGPARLASKQEGSSR